MTHHSYNAANHKICFYFYKGFILNNNKIECIVALKHDDKYILCRDIIINLCPILFRHISVRNTYIGIQDCRDITKLIEIINNKPIIEFNEIIINNISLYQFSYSKLNAHKIIEDLGELAFDFEGIYAIKGLPNKTLVSDREYTLVCKNQYAPYTNTDYCHCILFAQEYNFDDEYAIEVKKWFPYRNCTPHHDGIYKCGYISKEENKLLHDIMLKNQCQVLFGTIRNNKISINGGVEILKDIIHPDCSSIKYIKHLCRDDYYYSNGTITGEYKPYYESIDIKYDNNYIAAVLASNMYKQAQNNSLTFSAKDLYDLQCKLERNNKSYDDICAFIETYSASINKYKEQTRHTSIPNIELIQLILDRDDSLYRYINEQMEFNRLKDSVRKISNDYYWGYNEFIRKRGYSQSSLSTVQLKDICDNIYVIQDLNIKHKATQIANKYPDAFKTLYGNDSTTIGSHARDICKNEEKLNSLQEKHNKIGLLQRKAQKNAAYDSSIDGIPLYFFYWYYKKSFTDISPESESARQMIYSFKDGKSHYMPHKLICDKLKTIYSEEELRQLTFACVPASMLIDNYKRLCSFYNDVCNTLGMRNGFDFIHTSMSGIPSHRGGNGIENIDVDIDFFKNALVVVFDDITTRGRSIRLLIRKLEEAGAKVIYCITLGKTYSDYYGDNRKSHPHTGTL